MILGSRAFYAELDGIIYAFQSKRQRDNSGGKKVSASYVYSKENKQKPRFLPVWFWQYEDWKGRRNGKKNH